MKNCKDKFWKGELKDGHFDLNRRFAFFHKDSSLEELNFEIGMIKEKAYELINISIEDLFMIDSYFDIIECK